MLSRLQVVKSVPLYTCTSLPVSQRWTHTSQSSNSALVQTEPKPGEVYLGKEGPERDLVNFPRLPRPEYPGKVRMAFVPEEYFQFFYNKTGVTGPYLFGAGLLTFLYSKEYLVMDHEFYAGLGLAFIGFIAAKKYGKAVANYLDKEIDAEVDEMKEYQTNQLKQFKDAVEKEKLSQWQTKGQAMLFEAKRHNVAMQLEAAFRQRQLEVYQQVKKRLDYQVEVGQAKARVQQRHMINWIVDSVRQAITPQQEKEALSQCISDLKGLAARA